MTSLPPTNSVEPVYCAIVDSAYFIGAVALVNSLRLTGHTGEIAFLDVGLTPYERAFLEQEARVHAETKASGWLSVFIKPTLGLLEPDRTVVLLDNDLIITGSLEPLVQAANEGSIAVFEDATPTRRFEEWHTLFSLRQPLRSGSYANGSCIALQTGYWKTFLERWYDLGNLVAAQRAERPFFLRRQEVLVDPVGFNEQDTLNALLMSEVPESALRFWPHSLTPNWEERGTVEIVDMASLRCRAAGADALYLHFTGQPKAWQPKGWLRIRFEAFNRLLTRVLTGDDVPLQLRVDEVPLWLRGGAGARLVANSAATLARVAYGSLSIMPTGPRARLTAAVRARVSGTGGKGAGRTEGPRSD